MVETLAIDIGGLQLCATLDDGPTAVALRRILPLEIEMSRWGGEYYGACLIEIGPVEDARSEMAVGEVAYWPPGRALCIFFGPTPASTGREPRMASAGNPIGMIVSDVASLEGLPDVVSTNWSLTVGNETS